MTSTLRRIGIIAPREQEYSERLLEGGLAYSAEHRAIKVTELSYPVDRPGALELPDPFPFDAALIWATPEAPWIDSLLDLSIPLISASGDIAPGLIPCLAFGHRALVDSAVDHLARCEPKCLVYLQFATVGNPLLEKRLGFFKEAGARHGLPVRSGEIFLLESEEFNAQNRSQPLGRDPLKRLTGILKELPVPSAIWCGDDGLAQRVCEVAGELGLRIPQDLAVLGLGDFRSARSGEQALSTIPLPGETIAYQALSILHQKLGGKDDFPDYIPVKAPPVLVRETTLSTSADDPISQALNIIARQACDNLSVSQVADAISMSSQALHSRFVKRVGHSPGEEIRRIKIARAKSDLRNPRLSIAEIAARTGYNEQSKFSNFFKRETGSSPSQWRRDQA